MFDSKTIDDLAAKLGRAFEASPAKDVEKNVKALLKSGLSRLDLVTREEFDLQVEVLKRTREKIDALEARVAALEAHVDPAHMNPARVGPAPTDPAGGGATPGPRSSPET